MWRGRLGYWEAGSRYVEARWGMGRKGGGIGRYGQSWAGMVRYGEVLSRGIVLWSGRWGGAGRSWEGRCGMGRFREVLGVVGRYAEASRGAGSYDVFGGVGRNWEVLGEYVAMGGLALFVRIAIGLWTAAAMFPLRI